MPQAPVNGIELYYEEHGVPDGPPLLLVHGYTGAAWAWERTLPPFAEKYRVIVPELRGHGRSTGDPETIHHVNFAADLVALLDHLGIDQAHFVGHSSGGMSLLFVGTRHQDRVRTLTLVNATYRFDDVAKAYMMQVVEEFSIQPEAIAAVQRVHGPTHGEGYWQVLREAFRQFTLDPDELPFDPPDLSVITRPVLVLHGDRDPFFPINIPVAMYQAMPNAELCILPYAGHDIPAADEALFLTITQRFLERHADA
ncbi:MAG TPA: alpha/beta hydrolase [Thermomicrobiales bacterium]|nr:alpha/beta hydrolase [Thermomicrobiales bacterium]